MGSTSGDIGDNPVTSTSTHIQMETIAATATISEPGQGQGPGPEPDVEETETQSSVCDQIMYGILSIASFIYQNSYIFTNILMMVWSIVYHSWLTFVLLLWANLLWMIPNQRKAMMRSSPFIVLYAELLLLAQYIYGMNLKNEELPSKVNITGINLAQIGFTRPLIPCIPLFVKTAFLLMFWVTLRQYLKEKTEIRRSNTLADIFAPLHITIGTVNTSQTTKKTSIFLKRIGDIFKNLLVRLWIWLLILVIFLCAITGKHMTGFRICYMALFLFFLLVFQTSSKAWVKIMYGFWLFLIFYVMSILILIYTYQFDKFDEYWNEYLNIPPKLQLDIGLEQYETKDLFLHLVSPTLIVVLTVIQVHYFHKRFIEALQKAPSTEDKRKARRRSMDSDFETYHSEDGFKRPVIHLIKIFFRRAKRRLIWIIKNFKDIFWRFLELHLIKLVYLTGFICCVSEVCVLHLLFLMVCVLGVCSQSGIKTFLSRVMSLIVSIIVLTKMIYQVTYLDHSQYDTNCTTSHQGNVTLNDADWFGLRKADPDKETLMSLLRLYIVYMITVTLHAVVNLRQYQFRNVTGTQLLRKPHVLFPQIARADAEKNLSNMIKYLLNYGFYRFGVEISLIWLVTTVSYRQDIVAILYVIWLVLLMLLRRKQIARIWVLFGWFVAISIVVQYVLLVGLPRSLCIIYPWETTEYNTPLQRWAMLPGDLHLNHVSKLVFDFILLMLIHRQQRVFNISTRPQNSDAAPYPGGSNKNVVSDIAKLGQVPFENPTRDFLSHVRNYLDIFQNIVLSGFFWVTLAVVFVGGTNIFNFFALGYLVGAFVFLWEGSDFYLRPIDAILKRWKYLIAYNVANITMKTFLEIGGCFFLNELTSHTCWLVHILGTSCLTRPYLNNTPEVDPSCPEIRQSSVHWDAICFAFLIFQLRIFKSHYFCHIILDARANNILAARGAEIIEDLRHKQIEHRQEHEREVLLKIKRKMEKIRATQQKMLRPIDNPTHFDEHGNPVPASRPHKRREPRLHAEAVRAGDYYMFDDMDDKFELDIIEDGKDFFDEQEQLTESEKKMTLRKTLFDVWKDLSCAEYRRQLYLRQRSYASAPGSHFDFNKIDGRDNTLGGDASDSWEGDTGGGAGIRISTHSEPLAMVHSKSEYFAKRRESMSVAKRPAEEEKTESLEVMKTEDEVDQPSEEITKRSDPDKQAEKEDEEQMDANPIARLVEGFLVSLIVRLNRFSRNYRYVNKILAEEKRVLKESGNLTRMSRLGAASMFNMFKKNVDGSINEDTAQINAGTSQNDITQLTAITPTETNLPSQLQSPQDSIQEQQQHEQQPPEQIEHADHDIIEIPLSTIDKVDGTEKGSAVSVHNAGVFSFDDAEFAARDHHIFVELIISLWYAILSNTDLICYIVIFINQVCNASVLSLPLPIMVFLWGTLSLPRPTKTFWVTLIAYTQAIVLIKCIFQYRPIWSFIPRLDNPLNWDKILGVEQRVNYANIDLLVLLILFFHRFILKTHGLWKSKNSFADEIISIDNYEADGENVLREEKSGGVLSEDTDDWKDAESNPELLRDSTSSQLVKKDERPSSNDGRKDGGGELPFNQNAQSEGQLVRSSSITEAADKYRAGLKRLKQTRYLSALRKFFYNIMHKPRLNDDVYALMFLCDFINFFVLLFGFSSFSSSQSKTDDGVQTYLSENKVPIPFLIMLLVQFLLVVIDRALYLRKAIVPKIIFHYLSVVGVHIWMFFVVPYVTERRFYQLAPPIIFYIFKCFYMLLSSYQIKCGYPRRILGNFLTKGFSVANMISFKVFMIMPFLYELRTILDWLCTDTTMTMFDWMKMEDIFSDIFVIRCSRQMEQDFPAIRAQKKTLIPKLFLGGTIILAIIILIWGPLCIFALGKTVGESNLPYEVTVTIRIGPYAPVYHTNNRESIYAFNEYMYENMTKAFPDSDSLNFINGYDPGDIVAIKLAGNSPLLWTISPPDKERLLSDLEEGKTLTARFMYSLTRYSNAKGETSVASSEIKFDMTKKFEGRQNLTDMILGNSTQSTTVTFPHFVPKFLKIPNKGNVAVVNALMQDQPKYRPLILHIHRDTGNLWWEIRDFCNDKFHVEYLKNLPLVDCNSGVVMYVFNEKKFPKTLDFVTATGILGIYTTFVLVASRFLKGYFSGQNHKIMFQDLPYVDRVLQLCLDIYLVREALEFTLEEDLFAKLIFLYRSPETLIKWTRPKEDRNEDETDSESTPSRTSTRRVHVEQHPHQE